VLYPKKYEKEITLLNNPKEALGKVTHTQSRFSKAVRKKPNWYQKQFFYAVP